MLGDVVPRPFASQYARLRSVSENEAVAYSLVGATPAHPLPTKWTTSLREDARMHVRAGFTLRQVREEIYIPPNADAWTTCRTCGDEHGNFGSRVRSLLAGWACHPSLLGSPNAIGSLFRVGHYHHREAANEQMLWAVEHLSEAVPGHDDLIEAVLDAGELSNRTKADLRLIGYFTYPTGIGRIARWTLEILDDAGLHPAIDCVSVGRDSPEYLSALLRRRNPMSAPDASVLCFINADQWEDHVAAPGRVNTSVAHVEVTWAWELEYIPEQMIEVATNSGIKRVHALSSWSVQAMEKALPVAVERMAPFDVGLFDVLKHRMPEAVTGAPTQRYILTTFDAKSYLGRKNPEAILELWRRVQNDFPNCRLTIKCSDLRQFAPLSFSTRSTPRRGPSSSTSISTTTSISSSFRDATSTSRFIDRREWD